MLVRGVASRALQSRRDCSVGHAKNSSHNLQGLADVACSTGFVDRGVWLRIAKQFLSCALVRGRGVVFRQYYKSIAKCAGKDYRDVAVVPFE